jgi:integrase
MQAEGIARRAYGTGSLIERTDKSGRKVYYAKWRTDAGRQIMRRIGDKRAHGSPVGLTKAQAEKELRRVMDDDRSKLRPSERLTLVDVGKRYLDELRNVRQRKRATVDDYRIMLTKHFEPFFGDRSIDAIEKRDVDAYVRTKLGDPGEPRKSLRKRGRVAAQTVTNQLNFLHGIFEFAVDEGWATKNPVRGVRRPKPQADEDIRFLDEAELEALLRIVVDDEFGELDRVLYLTAAMTGLRQGELVALRWRDVDWASARIRVRRGRSRGELGTPKSKRSSRAVPMADRVASELEGR